MESQDKTGYGKKLPFISLKQTATTWDRLYYIIIRRGYRMIEQAPAKKKYDKYSINLKRQRKGFWLGVRLWGKMKNDSVDWTH